METDKLIEIIKLQSQIIEILCKEFTNAPRNPYEKDYMWDLIRQLKNLQKELI